MTLNTSSYSKIQRTTHTKNIGSCKTTMFLSNFLWHSWQTRSSWLNCALRDDEAVYWVSRGHYKAEAVGDWWYWVSRRHSCLYILQKVEIWTSVTDAWLTHSLTHHWQTLKDRAIQLFIKYKGGALVTQLALCLHKPGSWQTRPSILCVTQERAFMPVCIEKVEIWACLKYRV